jgi:high-affinity iron transporter
VFFGIGYSLEGKAEQIFEGVTMFLAAGVLTWMIFWMARQSRSIKSELETDVRRAVNSTGTKALYWLAFFAVVREGVELVLFLTASAFASSAAETLVGAALGLMGALILGWLVFESSLRLDLRRFFLITGTLLILFSAGLVAHGVSEFNEVGWIPNVIEHVWDINFLVNESSVAGEMLKAFFGYNGNPSLTEILAYAAYFAAILIGLRRSGGGFPATQKA